MQTVTVTLPILGASNITHLIDERLESAKHLAEKFDNPAHLLDPITELAYTECRDRLREAVETEFSKWQPVL